MARSPTLLMERGGHPTDIGRDFDYWEAVDAFASACAQLTAPART
jgi:hypothetical protein